MEVEYVLTYEDKVANCNVFAKPMASKRLLRKCFKLVKKARRNEKSNIVYGLKDVQKGIQKGETGIALIAGDVKPIDVMCHLAAICEEHNIPYVYVPSREDLGVSIKLKRSCITLLIKFNKAYERRFNKLLNKLKYLTV